MTAPSMLPAWAWVSVGGAIGATLRWALTTGFDQTATGFGGVTFILNVLGSGALAWLLCRTVRDEVRLLIGPGVLGGFTTLSAVSEHTRQLIEAGEAGLAAAYSAATFVACLGAVVLVRRLSGGAHGD